MEVNRDVFKFKQFEVNQAGCAMKINTDGVLIAAMSNHEMPKKILDIGTGTGVVALMLAQRFPEADVHAVEIDYQAAEAADKNFRNSIFSNRLSVSHVAIEHYIGVEKFDLIVSNPPFFVNDLKNEEKRKGIARHADEDFFEMLINKSKSILSDHGKLWLILPLKQARQVEEIGLTIQLFAAEKIYIHSDESKPPFRMMICLSKEKMDLLERKFYIYQSLKVHTEEYKMLLKDFFLNF
ncbi:tRNA1(Val) (adenine(37)-N6)-methyltransferase [Pedobacter sp. Leaf176]|uniref:tRNA1(Val) (adenine(37)-N6)-methyltransferase n=1 Tax=Pedobacter sp. Leaf176 TaxID=1736286 RepID=UPI0006F3AB83|nr:methyltransferase [Pedobacter sp. Leaf176]KQR70233.1 tRNA methyltransferase [Pedobacter sp. Leaf176]